MGLVATRRMRLRAPGVKTGSTIGPLGPFRGTLGIQWVIGSIAVGLLLVLAGSWFFLREPQPPFEKVETFTFEELTPGTARPALAPEIDGVPRVVFVGEVADGTPYAVLQPQTCELEVIDTGYLDCAGRRYGFDGVGHKASLTVLPIDVHRGTIYIDTSAAG